VIRPKARVLDLACGSGRHGIAAPRLGASVVAIDWDVARIPLARERRRDLRIRWIAADLKAYPIPREAFDVLMIFNYLDRVRIHDLPAVPPPLPNTLQIQKD
jgi:ubiquinone/menaquinone biosynthesis C-methylase UbiE